ncbi:MAG TPA: glycosyltransferase family 39 protein, partial [Anaerolineales bacterium]|nr:glycosyltransferase family 39 protein [Anaerolineales bacterium]
YVPPAPSGLMTDIAILDISSSLGNVPYGELDYQGWEQEGSKLVLRDPLNNRLSWSGPTGTRAVITFQRSTVPATINISWNEKVQSIDLSTATGKTYIYNQKFAVPFFASRPVILFLGGLNFFIICCAINLLIWRKRNAISDYLEQAIVRFPALSGGRTTLRTNAAKKGAAVQEWAIIVGIVGVAILLRIPNLENVSPYIDEYNHLLAAKALLQDSVPLSAVYQRSLWIVTIPVYLSLRLFHLSLWAARLPGVLFNLLALVPLYLVTRKINKQVAFLSCILYATNPWLIAASRTVREYGYYPFYFYWAGYFMILFAENFPDRFVVFKDWRKILTAKLGILTLALVLPVIYAFYDRESTFKVILIMYGAFGLFLAGKIDWRNKMNSLILISSGALVVAGLYLFFMRSSSNLVLHFNAYALGYFLYAPEQQWYFERPAILPAVALLSAILMTYGLQRLNRVPVFLFTLCMSYALFYLSLFYHNTLPRYYLILQLWVLILLAMGLYGISVFLSTLFPKNRVVLIVMLIIGSLYFFNPLQILFPAFYYQHALDPVTEEYHDDVTQVHSFLLKNATGNDILISKTYRLYDAWVGKPKFKFAYSYKYDQDGSRDNVYGVISKFDSGWIVIDDDRFRHALEPLPATTFTLGDKLVVYLGMMGDQHVYRWCEVNSSSGCN